MKPADTIRIGTTLGECILWDGETQSLWWTDIDERRLYRLDWKSRAISRFVTPERLCSFGFVEGGKDLIAAFESGFAFYDPAAGEVNWIARLSMEPGVRLNDGRVDRAGRFWAGSMVENEDQANAELYCFDGEVHRRQAGVTISNSICWSPDGSRFYFADSPTRTIWRYAYSAADGTVSDRRVFARTSPECMPDGSTVDAEGFLWNAQWGGGRIVRYAPDGRIDRLVELPVSQPSCVAFGGPKLDLLFVTSARRALSSDALKAQPQAGDVLVYDVGVRGLPESRFRRTSGKPQ